MGRWAQAHRRGAVAPGSTAGNALPAPTFLDYSGSACDPGDGTQGFEFTAWPSGEPRAACFTIRWGLADGVWLHTEELGAGSISSCISLEGTTLFDDAFVQAAWSDCSGNLLSPWSSTTVFNSA
jgi:hypothetical protein